MDGLDIKPIHFTCLAVEDVNWAGTVGFSLEQSLRYTQAVAVKTGDVCLYPRFLKLTLFK